VDDSGLVVGRVAGVRPRAVAVDGLGQLPRQVVGRAHEQDGLSIPLGAVADEAVADALLFQIGDHARPEERTLADAALAVEHQQPRPAVVEQPGKPNHVGLAACEQGPVRAVVILERAVRLLRQRQPLLDGGRAWPQRCARPRRLLLYADLLWPTALG